MALVIHRFWKQLGFTMPKVLAWFITFNFINIGWVFFRAKEWDDALKVLGGMTGLNGIVLPKVLATKLVFLSQYNVEFGGFVDHINGGESTLAWLFFGFFLILSFKNSS